MCNAADLKLDKLNKESNLLTPPPPFFEFFFLCLFLPPPILNRRLKVKGEIRSQMWKLLYGIFLDSWFTKSGLVPRKQGGRKTSLITMQFQLNPQKCLLTLFLDESGENILKIFPILNFDFFSFLTSVSFFSIFFLFKVPLNIFLKGFKNCGLFNNKSQVVY